MRLWRARGATTQPSRTEQAWATRSAGVDGSASVPIRFAARPLMRVAATRPGNLRTRSIMRFKLLSIIALSVVLSAPAPCAAQSTDYVVGSQDVLAITVFGSNNSGANISGKY